VLEEKTTASGMPTRSYVLGGDIVAQSDATLGTQLLVIDGHGSTRGLMNLSGVTVQMDYDAFGTPLNFDAKTNGTDIEFVGEHTDAITGQRNHRLRWVDGFNFTSEDTYWGDDAEPISLHGRLYANGSPMMFTDPTGMFSLGETLSVFGNMSKQIGQRVTAAYQVYERAETIRDASGLAAQFITTGTVDPIVAASLMSDFLPFGKALKRLGGALDGNRLFGARQTLTAVYDRFKAVNGRLDKASEFVGEVGAGLVAKAHGFIPTNFPRKYHGIESVFEDAAGNLVIIEAKGGSASLRDNQMSQQWIRKKIQALRDSSDPVASDWYSRLAKAERSGKIRGGVVHTEVNHATGDVFEPEFEFKNWAQIGPDRF
jgi:hypothetical protein